MRRILSVWFPLLATDRIRGQIRRMGEAEIAAPMATLVMRQNSLVLEAVDAAGQAQGLAPGTGFAEARAMVPELRGELADHQADRDFLLALARAADRYTPLVGLAPPDGLFLDVTGCAHLFGGEAGLIDDLRGRLRRWGIAGRIAVADWPALAWALARHGEGGIVAVGEGGAAVGPLPVAALRMPDDSTAMLTRLGLKSVADVLRQPRIPLIRRFGPALGRRLDEIEGKAGEPITPLLPVAPFQAERRFAEPLMQMDGILAALTGLAERLAERLEARGMGARQLRVRLFHADGAVRDVTVGASLPLADPVRMVTLLKPRIEQSCARVERESGIDLLRLGADEAAPVAPHQDDFDGTEAACQGLARLVDMLTERLGPHNVECFRAVDTHQPAAAHARVPARDVLREGAGLSRSGAGNAAVSGGEALPARPVRLFTPPEPVEVLAGLPDGPPMRFSWRRVSHQVAHAHGPERITPEWWRADAGLPCDYFRVEDVDGQRFWMFRSGLYGGEEPPRWFMHGLFG